MNDVGRYGFFPVSVGGGNERFRSCPERDVGAPGSPDRRDRHVLPPARSARPRRLLAVAAHRNSRHHRGTGGPLGPARPVRQRAVPSRWPAGWIPRPGRPVRRGVLRHLPARGRHGGPPAAAGTGTRLGGPGGRRDRPRKAARHPQRRVRRGDVGRLRHRAATGRARGDQPAHHDRAAPQRHREPAVVQAGAAGSEPGRGHGPVLLARRGPPGMREPAAGGVHRRARRWREPHARRRKHRHGRSSRRVVARRPVPHLRRARERLCPRRGRGRCGPETPCQRPGGRRPDLLRDPRQRGQQRRRW